MSELEKEFILYEQALVLKELGFDELCIGYYYNGKIYLNSQGVNLPGPSGEQPLPLYQQAFRWFREKYDLHVQIRKEDYFYKNVHSNYFHFDISKGQQQDITEQQDLYYNITDECKQDIPGNYLDNEKLNILIFERGFAFNTYEEAELACLKKLIEIVKEIE